MQDNHIKDPAKIGKLVERFRKIYALPETKNIPSMFVPHDAVHVMTGLGIGIADEQRVSIYEVAMAYPWWRRGLGTAFSREKSVHEGQLQIVKGERVAYYESPGQLAPSDFCRVQVGTVRLDKREVEEQFVLGQQMNQIIRQLTGKGYRRLTGEEVANLDFEKVDFTAQAHAIKNKYEKPENREIEKTMAGIFHDASVRRGRADDIPAAGFPWHGPLKKSYSVSGTP